MKDINCDENVIFDQEGLFKNDNLLVYKRNELIHAKFDLSTFAQKAMEYQLVSTFLFVP